MHLNKALYQRHLYKQQAYRLTHMPLLMIGIELNAKMQPLPTIQNLKTPDTLKHLDKDNTWAVPNGPENKHMLVHKSMCGQFVSTAFCKMAVERFMKVEKLGSTNEFGNIKINSFAVCD